MKVGRLRSAASATYQRIACTSTDRQAREFPVVKAFVNGHSRRRSRQDAGPTCVLEGKQSRDERVYLGGHRRNIWRGACRHDDAGPAGVRPRACPDARRRQRRDRRGELAAGAETILVVDGHGPMRNLQIEDLDPAATLVTGDADARPYCQLQDADSMPFDAAIFVGYHAMAKTLNAIHPHTIAGAVVHEIRVNGRPHGETGLNALVLASLGDPDSDGDRRRDHLCRGAVIPRRRDRDGGGEVSVRPQLRNLPPPEADGEGDPRRPLAVRLERRREVPLYLPGKPLSIEVDFLTMPQCDRASRCHGIDRLNGVTIAVHGDIAMGAIPTPLGGDPGGPCTSPPPSSRDGGRRLASGPRTPTSSRWGRMSAGSS